MSAREGVLMTEPEVVAMLANLIRAWSPKRVVELGSGPSTTPALREAAALVGATFESIDTESPYATHRGDAAVFLREARGIDFLFSDAGDWGMRVECARLAREALSPGGFVAFHDIQPDTPLAPTLKALGVFTILPPDLTDGRSVWGGLALWRKPL